MHVQAVLKESVGTWIMIMFEKVTNWLTAVIRLSHSLHAEDWARPGTPVVRTTGRSMPLRFFVRIYYSFSKCSRDSVLSSTSAGS